MISHSGSHVALIMRSGQKSARSASRAAGPRQAAVRVGVQPQGKLAATSPDADPEVGHLFTQLRLALGVPAETLARLLGTSPATIAALEAGNVALLPAWPETERVLRAYTSLAGIDPLPMLSRIRALLDQPAARALPGRSSTGTAVAMLPKTQPRLPENASKGAKPQGKTRARSASQLLPFKFRPPKVSRRMAVLSTMVGVIGAVFMAVGPLYAAMPVPAQRAISAAIDRIAWGSTVLPDGMRFIDPANPRARRGDKLQSTSR